MSDYLPEDAWTSILIRLPVKSLVNCTLVCKSWYSLIKNPNFITDHLYHTTNHKLLVKEYSENRERDIYTLRHDNQTLDLYLELECPFEIDDPYTILLYCNGLLCLYKPFGLPVLWNPSIRKYLTLPEPHIPIGQILSSCVYGLGFHSSTNDYKVVRVVYSFSDGDFHKFQTKAELYTLSSGTWRNIDASFPQVHLSDGRACRLFMNGAVHWDGYYMVGKGDARNSIVSFDMTHEVFREIKLPMAVGFLLSLPMAVFEGCLCFAESHFDIQKSSIWVMKEYGVVESWVRHFVIDVQIILSFCFRKEGQVLLEMYDESDEYTGYYLLSYDPNTGGIEDFGIYGIHRNSLSLHVGTYVESLVLLR